MRRSPDQVEQFLRAARLRWTLWRTIERIGISLLVGCAVAFILSLILLWRGQSAVLLAGGTVALSALAGLTAGIISRPSLLKTAMETDRQLDLHDLLGTALQLRENRYLDDAWRENFRCLAQARVRELSPSQLVLNRLGARAWSGIGLSAALVMTIALMTMMPSKSMARLDRGEPFESLDETRESANGVKPLAVASSRVRSRRGDQATDARSQSTTSNDRSADHEKARGAGADAINDSSDGSGAAAGTTESPAQRNDPKLMATADSSGEPGGTAASGFGSSARTDSAGAAVGGVSRTPTTRSTPPWQSNTWPADRAAAIEALRSGRIPDAYRDLVREYFSREQN